MRERLSFADTADIDEFVAMLEKFERGEISSEAWRKFRLVRGTYGQRQDDQHMLRVKIPQGILTARQLLVVADVAEQFARGFAHVTTRQNVQFHFLELDKVEHVMRLFADEGVTTREACGNSVRNITACPFAGVSSDEVFDVTPYAEALTRYLLRHPLASVLPRKFKIAFEGCSVDHAFASINDLGWTARIEERDGDTSSRLSTDRRGRNIDLAGVGPRALRFPAGSGDAQRRGSHSPCLRRTWRSRAPSAQSHEVPDQIARLGTLAQRGALGAGGRRAGRRRRLAVRP